MNGDRRIGGASWTPGVLIAVVLALGLLVVGYVLLEKGGGGSKGILEELLGFRQVIDDGGGGESDGEDDGFDAGPGDDSGGGTCSGEPAQSRTDGLYGCGALNQEQCQAVSDETSCTWDNNPMDSDSEKECFAPSGESGGSELCDAINNVNDVQSACENAGCEFTDDSDSDVTQNQLGACTQEGREMEDHARWNGLDDTCSGGEVCYVNCFDDGACSQEGREMEEMARVETLDDSCSGSDVCYLDCSDIGACTQEGREMEEHIRADELGLEELDETCESSTEVCYLDCGL